VSENLALQTDRDPCRLVRQVKEFCERSGRAEIFTSETSRQRSGKTRSPWFSLTKLLHLPGKLAGVGKTRRLPFSLTKLIHLPDEPAGVGRS
jgi:hypothetical protein